jgi:hypothetical protein
LTNGEDTTSAGAIAHGVMTSPQARPAKYQPDFVGLRRLAQANTAMSAITGWRTQATGV